MIVLTLRSDVGEGTSDIRLSLAAARAGEKSVVYCLGFQSPLHMQFRITYLVGDGSPYSFAFLDYMEIWIDRF